jgi:hypothetical protein
VVGSKAVDARGDDAKCLERGQQWRNLDEGVADRVGMGDDDDLDVREEELLPVPRLEVRDPRLLVHRQFADRLDLQPVYADLAMFAFLAVLRAWAVLAFVALRQEALDEAGLSGRRNIGDIPAEEHPSQCLLVEVDGVVQNRAGLMEERGGNAEAGSEVRWIEEGEDTVDQLGVVVQVRYLRERVSSAKAVGVRGTKND